MSYLMHCIKKIVVAVLDVRKIFHGPLILCQTIFHTTFQWYYQIAVLFVFQRLFLVYQGVWSNNDSRFGLLLSSEQPGEQYLDIGYHRWQSGSPFTLYQIQELLYFFLIFNTINCLQIEFISPTSFSLSHTTDLFHIFVYLFWPLIEIYY